MAGLALDRGLSNAHNRPMYDVIYVDNSGVETTLAGRVTDRGSAAEIARRHAAELNVGRMILPGS